jgi:hypothetical protein
MNPRRKRRRDLERWRKRHSRVSISDIFKMIEDYKVVMQRTTFACGVIESLTNDIMANRRVFYANANLEDLFK